ncbi:hypothetical protein RD792_016141 [Penstemon davidsonii]|uniref:Uncharacterized protein n=1 Tax=Penstemon davidsonii TaxID=160366 RepID=A0ABR0CJJ1_9LAMI|nr:hypothetical protein RD792_016141 [Penstemon davidsonii]
MSSMLKLFLLIVLFYSSAVVLSQSVVVENLPGFWGKLPFRLETGYIGVGESEELQLFYYFIESERNPEYDPLILWLTGGPSCSGFSGLVYEIGPLSFDFASSGGSIPTLILNPYSWTKVASIIFLDQPAGSGFSYAETSEAYNSSDKLAVAHIYEFLKKWLINHPKYLNNSLYVAGDSYAGITVPLVVNELYNGNPLTDVYADFNGRISHAHRMGLLSDKLYQNNNYRFSYNWANNKFVQKALHVREGTMMEWVRSNSSMTYDFDYNQTVSYTFDVKTTVNYHQKFTHKSCRALIYSGDHDMVIPHTRTEEWIDSLQLFVQSDWRPWFVEGQIAGYTMEYFHGDYELTYATVKGAGHTAPEYKPLQCLSMLERWFSNSSL